MSSITELNRTNGTQSPRLVRSDFVRQKDKMQPVLIESERYPSRMYVKKFEKKKISINLELAKIFFVKGIRERYPLLSDSKSINSQLILGNMNGTVKPCM